MAPSGSGTNGNTKRASAAKHWCFTLNNYNLEHINILIQLFGSNGSKYIFQEETGANGTKHLQGYVAFSTKVRPSECCSVKEIHWEKTRNIKASQLYCCKSDTRTGEIYSNMALPLEDRVDTRLSHLILSEWQQNIENIYKTTPDDRSVYWIVDLEGGKGKTLFCKYMQSRYRDVCVISATKSADIITLAENYYSTYLIDIPRCIGEFCPFNAIEQLKNGFVTDCKLKKSARVINCAPPHIFVFSNFYPDKSKLSADRWKILEII